jgi:succinate-semialdehyde dehydrogenase/glutarate-semialdehyde dehydrogenase
VQNDKHLSIFSAVLARKESAMAYQTINPYTGETLATFPDATDEAVRAAISGAHNSFLAWRGTSFAERGVILQRAADLLRRDSDAYASC